jgi:predicted nucleotidyltransferase
MMGKIKIEVDLKEIKRKILPILQRYGVKRAGLFGSCVGGKMREEDPCLTVLPQIFASQKVLSRWGHYVFKLNTHQPIS